MDRSRGAVFAAVALLVALPVAAQQGEAPPEMSPEEAAATAAWEAAATPGPEHERLAGMAGEWALTVSMWMQPGAEPVVSQATASRRMILGGRYLEEEVTGEFMGTQFVGRGLSGYDNVTGRHWGTWVDSASTALMESNGTWDEATSSLVMEGSYSDPMTGARVPFRSVLKVVSPDEEVYTSWETRDGQEVKTMEIVSRRK